MSDILRQKLMVLFVSITLIFAFVGFLVLNQSLAWFSENKEVTADGLSLNAKVSPNLIIASSKEDIQNDKKFDFSIDFEIEENRTKMIAVTHTDEEGSEGEENATFLKYVTNHYAIDHHTGLPVNAYDPGFAFVPLPEEGAENPYYIDYEVYIASAYEPLNVSSLKVSITIPEEVTEKYLYFNAASIDFYVGEVSAEGYRGTASVAGNTAVDIFLPDEEGNVGGTVPLNTTENGYIKVIMRCYFDGALTYSAADGGTHAYINSNEVTWDNKGPIYIGVEFVAIEDTQ